MLDEKTQMMLEAASALTAEDLEFLKSGGHPVQKHEEIVRVSPDTTGVVAETKNISTKQVQTFDNAVAPVEQISTAGTARNHRNRARKNKTIAKASPFAGSLSTGAQTVASSHSRGEYERNRTRESKVSTACLGAEREKHEWWPLGTELIARLGNEVFEATVVENSSVKSGRSLVITSGPALGKVCITPTRAAIEATEAFRAANHFGRGGGVTNGWTFWQLKK